MHKVSCRITWLVFALILRGVPTVAAGQPSAVTGTVVDLRGSAIEGARVTLAIEGQSPLNTLSNSDGQFSFANVYPAPFHVTVDATGFDSTSLPGKVNPGETLALAPITLQVAPLTTNVEVTLTQNEIAQEEVKTEEKQRLLGVLPNYYVTYEPHPAPLTAKQKFDLAWKTSYDPITLGINAIVAGVQQARNTYSGYGQGTEGYAKRYAASYGDFLSGLMISGAVLPSLLKQDPRYFYKGTGSKKSRVIYALERAFICQGDNGRPEFNYSSIIGGLAAGGISNLYYPAKSRDGAGLTFENAGLGIASNAIGNIVQEFFFRKITPKASQADRSRP